MYARVFILFCLQICISEGTICYSCSGYDHPRDCAHVTKCGVNQACYVETNIKHNGLPVYDSGCIDQTACPAILHPDVSDIIVGKRAGPFCKLCCDKDYCNDELCDLHKDDTLGPRCLSCTGIRVQDLSKCVTITQCARDEICYTERIGDSFRAGCVLEKDCKLTRSPVNAVGKRAPVTSCAQCCDKSYCNAHLCGLGNNTAIDYNVFEMHTNATVNSGSCDDSSYETCQYLLTIKSDSCSDINMQRLCPRTCNLCVDITCTDNATFDCADVARSFNICSELSSAREKCRKFCGFCKYVNGQWTNWSSWTQCSRTCNNGTRQRTRSCTNPSPMNGGSPCPGDKIESTPCGQSDCPVNGGWTEYGVWTNCTTFECFNIGSQSRTRSCTNPSPAYGGLGCPGSATDKRRCIGYGPDCRSKIRLVGGSSGLLQVNLHGEWGTVCDDSFGTNDAQAVCRALGLPYANAVVTDENGSGTILLDDVVCEPGGIFPRDCNFNLDENCNHNEDVGVTCS